MDINNTVILNQKNVEELIFFNHDARKLLIDFSDIFQMWELGIRVPGLKPTAQKAVLDFLEQINDNHILILKKLFNSDVVVEKLDYCIIKNYEMKISDAQEFLNKAEKYDKFITYRNGEQLYISFWR